MAAFNERNPHTTQQQEPVAMSPGGPCLFVCFILRLFPTVFHIAYTEILLEKDVKLD
jgi:hypothetical protein